LPQLSSIQFQKVRYQPDQPFEVKSLFSKVIFVLCSLRCLERFAQSKRLAELDRPDDDRYSNGFQLRKLPLPDHVVQFHLSNDKVGKKRGRWGGRLKTDRDTARYWQAEENADSSAEGCQ